MAVAAPGARPPPPLLVWICSRGRRIRGRGDLGQSSMDDLPRVCVDHIKAVASTVQHEPSSHQTRGRVLGLALVKSSAACGGVLQQTTLQHVISAKMLAKGKLIYHDAIDAVSLLEHSDAVADNMTGKLPCRATFRMAPEFARDLLRKPVLRRSEVQETSLDSVVQEWARVHGCSALDLDHCIACMVLSPLAELIVFGQWHVLAGVPQARAPSALFRLPAGQRPPRQRRRRPQQLQEDDGQSSDAYLFMEEVDEQQDEIEPAEEPPHDENVARGEKLDANVFLQLAVDLRRWSSPILLSTTPDQRDAEKFALEQAIAWMDKAVETLSPPPNRPHAALTEVSRGRKRWRYGMKALLKALFMSCCIRDSNQLRDVVHQALELVVPPNIIEALVSQSAAIPKKASLSRARIIADIGYMLWQRARWQTR